MNSNIAVTEMVRPKADLSFEVATGDQALLLKDIRAMLSAYNASLMTAHELITRVYSETGYQVQRLERDAVRLVQVVETSLGNVVTEMTVYIEESR